MNGKNGKIFFSNKEPRVVGCKRFYYVLALHEESGALPLIKMYNFLIETFMPLVLNGDERIVKGSKIIFPHLVLKDILDSFEHIPRLYNLYDYGKVPLTQDQIDLLYYAGMTTLTLTGTKGFAGHYIGRYFCAEYNRVARELLQKAAGRGHTKAKDVLKFGTGRIDKQYLYYKDDNVECSANDLSMTISFKLQDETVEAYETMLNFLIGVLKQGFPVGFKINFNSKLKNYIPIRKLKKSQTNQFFQNCAAYPSLYPQMKQYIHLAMNRSIYYADAEDEQAVNSGGYAAFALGMANADSNLDIVEEFIADTDFEHALTSLDFVWAFIEKWGKDKKYEKVLAKYEYYFS